MFILFTNLTKSTISINTVRTLQFKYKKWYLSKTFRHMADKNYFVHDTAVIDSSCIIGAGTQVWHFSLIMPYCVIGENCNIGQNVLVSSYVVLGENVKIENNASICLMLAGDEDFLGEVASVYTQNINSRSAFSCKDKFTKTYVGEGATIGYNATIICGNDIGKFAFVEMGAVVTSPVPDYALVSGNPARQIGWRSECRQKLQFDKNDIAICQKSGETYQLKNNKVIKCNSKY